MLCAAGRASSDAIDSSAGDFRIAPLRDGQEGGTKGKGGVEVIIGGR